MLSELFIALLLASPVAARDQAVGPPVSAVDPDVCSYVKDMKGMADGSAAKQQVLALEQRLQLACEKITWAVLTEREPAVNSAWREAVPKRRALVEKAVAILRKHAVTPKALEDTPENPAASTANADIARLPGYSAGEPLNAQSIAAWLPPEADGAKQVYAMWLVVQNSQLRGEKWGQEQQRKDPVSPERFKQIDDTLAANKARLKKMERIEDPGEFKSFVEGSVMGQGDSRNGVDAAGLLKPGGPSGESADNRPLKVQQSMRGVERKLVPMPSSPQSPSPAPTGSEPSEDYGLIGKALGFGGAAVAGALVLWRKRRDEQELDAAREEVAAEDRAHAVAKGEIIEPPALTSDPAVGAFITAPGLVAGSAEVAGGVIRNVAKGAAIKTLGDIAVTGVAAAGILVAGGTVVILTANHGLNEMIAAQDKYNEAIDTHRDDTPRTTTSDAEAMKQHEYRSYKNRCGEAPPPDLDLCARFLWELQREQDCVRMREEWDLKWKGNHKDEIESRKRAVINVTKQLQRNDCL